MMMAGPLARWGAAQEAGSDQSRKGPTPAKPLTLDELNARLDRQIGLTRMAVATMEKLVTWYQIDREHPDAKHLEDELCGNRRLVREADVQAHIDSDAYMSLMQSASLEDQRETNDKMSESTALMKKSTTLSRQLTAMGCVCPAEAPETTTAPAEAAPKSVDPADPTATLPNMLTILDLRKKGILLAMEGLEQQKGRLQTIRRDRLWRQSLCVYKPAEGALINTERDVKKFTGPGAPPMTAEERLALDVKWSEVQRLQSEWRRAFEYFAQHGISCP
jgi:hypothetical protein